MSVKFHTRKSALCLSVATTLATLPFSASATTLDTGGFLDTTTLNVTDFASSTAISRSAGTTREAFGIFDINVTFTQTVSQSVLSAFSAAEQFWESRILGYETVELADFLAANFPSVEITADIGAIDGVGGILGSAVPQTRWERSALHLGTPRTFWSPFQEI